MSDLYLYRGHITEIFRVSIYILYARSLMTLGSNFSTDPLPMPTLNLYFRVRLFMT